jgi:hypothetical protein
MNLHIHLAIFIDSGGVKWYTPSVSLSLMVPMDLTVTGER